MPRPRRGGRTRRRRVGTLQWTSLDALLDRELANAVRAVAELVDEDPRGGLLSRLYVHSLRASPVLTTFYGAAHGESRALVLIAPGGLVPAFRNRAAQRLANRYVATAVKAVVKDPDTLPPEVLDEFVREARRPRAGMAYGRHNQASLGPWSMRNNLLPVVSRVGVPTLFFHGQDDPLVDPEGARRASELMPDTRLVLVPDCGHWAQLEARDRFLADVRGFLANVDGSLGGTSAARQIPAGGDR